MHLSNDYTGCSEVGGLFVDPSRRAGGAGKLLARARYMFMAQHPNRFADKVIADLRGWRDDAGVWPFWEAVGRHFFHMDFQEADLFNGASDNRFIADLMPKNPVYVSLLPSDAQDAIGKAHREGEAALHMLQKEGFLFEGYVDVFDAGPTLEARLQDLRLMKDRRTGRVDALGDAPEGGQTVLIASREAPSDFRATIAPVQLGERRIACAQQVLQNLGLADGDVADWALT